MVTRFYFHAATSPTANLPTASQSSLGTPTVTGDAVTVNRSMDTSIGVSQASRAVTTSATSSAQKVYFTRFVSTPLATQTIPANTWTLNFAALESAGQANFPVANSGYPQIVCYVWRPGTGKVGSILESTSSSYVGIFNEASASTESVLTGTFTGSSLAVQAGDVLVYEFYFTLSQGNSTARTVTIYYDGTTVNTSDLTAATNHAAFLETPDTITFAPPTRFYLHNATSALAGTLPSAKASTMTATATFDAYSVNRVMDTTKSAGSQTDLTATKTNSSSTARMYMTRFLSPPLDQTSIAAKTWTLVLACWTNSSIPYYPATNTSYVPSCLYVWRPSTGAAVGTIFDGLSATTTAGVFLSSEKSQNITYAGSAVASMQTGDILVLEAWTATNSTSSYTFHYAYDGATITLADNTATSNHAAFLETPESLTFYVAPPDTIAMTPDLHTITNKFIVKI